MTKKIALFMVPPLTVGAGAGKYFIELAREFSERGQKVDVITLDRNFSYFVGRLLRIFYRLDFKGEGVGEDQESEDAIRKDLGGADWISVSTGELSETLKNYDVIYSKNEILELIFLKLFVGYTKLPPVIVGVHTPLYYPVVKTIHERLHNFIYLGFIYKWLLNGAELIHLSNRYTKELVDRIFNIKSEFVYYPFDVKGFRSKAKKNLKAPKFDPKKINIVFIAARLTEQKGVDSLINIIEKLSKSPNLTKKITINIFGKGPFENDVIEADKTHEFVNFHGYVPHSAIPTILSKQKLFITTAKWETFPYNVVEAQAMGLPVIAFDIAGPNEIVIDGKTGHIVETEDEFLACIIGFAEKPNQFDGKKIVESVEKRFSSEIIYNKLLEMFLSV